MFIKFGKSFLLASLFFITFVVRAEDRYVIIADASVPELASSANDICKFSDEVSPGSSLILALGVTALSLSVKDVSITSDLRILLYSDSKVKNAAPLVAFVAKPVTDKIPEKVKFNKHKFPCKLIGKRLFIAETDELLNAVKTLPQKDDSESALSVRLFPGKYFTDCGGTIEAFKAKLEKEFSKGRKDKDVEVKGEIKALEKLLEQCREVGLLLNAGTKKMAIDLTILPKEKSSIAKIINSTQGKITQEKFIELSEKIAGTQGLVITEEIKASLSFLLKQIFSDSDTKAIADKLCKFNIISEKNKLKIGIDITPQQAKDILTATGVLNKIEDKGERKKISF